MVMRWASVELRMGPVAARERAEVREVLGDLVVAPVGQGVGPGEAPWWEPPPMAWDQAERLAALRPA